MELKQAVTSGFSKYTTFTGRASRSEYWYWVLFVMLGQIVLSVIDVSSKRPSGRFAYERFGR
jgi:uncharacterized membrane protein YhaH (DUF805 family)